MNLGDWLVSICNYYIDCLLNGNTIMIDNHDRFTKLFDNHDRFTRLIGINMELSDWLGFGYECQIDQQILSIQQIDWYLHGITKTIGF